MTEMKRTFSKDCLSDALLLLMRDKKAADITVKEITQKAGVSRATWFRSFSDKREAVVYNLVRKWERWADMHNLKDPGKISSANVDSFVDYIYEIRGVRQALLKSDMQSTILDSFLAVLVAEHYDSGSPDFYTLQFMTYGMTGIVEGLAQEDYRTKKAQIAAYLRQFIGVYSEL